jgi:hypothetical protein
MINPCAERSGAFDNATSPGIEISVGPLSTTAVIIAVVTMALFGVDHSCDVEARGVEEFIWVQLFQGCAVYEPGLDIASDGNDRGALLASVHQPVE